LIQCQVFSHTIEIAAYIFFNFNLFPILPYLQKKFLHNIFRITFIHEQTIHILTEASIITFEQFIITNVITSPNCFNQLFICGSCIRHFFRFISFAPKYTINFGNQFFITKKSSNYELPSLYSYNPQKYFTLTEQLFLRIQNYHFFIRIEQFQRHFCSTDIQYK
jgi:hypothetical protein